jgi:hypothetical protein
MWLAAGFLRMSEKTTLRETYGHHHLDFLPRCSGGHRPYLTLKDYEREISVSQIGDSASVQAATRVNAEQSSKRTMRSSTRQPYRGRLIRLDEMSEVIRSDAAPG